jgi:O-antigen ligase
MFLVAAGSWATRWFARGEGADSLVSLNSRTDLWSLALGSTMRESPAIGLGVGASRSAFYAETGLGGGHNAVVNIVADLGLLGLLIWLPLITWPAVIVWRSGASALSSADRMVWIVAFVVLIVNSITYEGLGSPPTMAFTWMLMLSVVAINTDQVHVTTGGQPVESRAAGPGQHVRRGTLE